MDTLAEELKKGVASCEKLGVDACSLRSQDPRIRFYRVSKKHADPRLRKGTHGTKAFKYVEEKKAIAILLVKAIEKGTGQTEWATERWNRCGVEGLVQCFPVVNRTSLGKGGHRG